MKPFKTIEEQIKYLQSDKNMIVTDKSLLEQTLIDNNYYRFINSTKLTLCDGFNETGKHNYNSKSDKDWIECFKQELFERECILLETIQKENRLNSRLAYYLGLLVEEHFLNEIDRLEISKLLNQTHVVKQNMFVKSNKDLSEVWKYVSNAELHIVICIIEIVVKALKKLVKAPNNRVRTADEQEKYRNISLLINTLTLNMSFQELRTFKLLRNSVVHQMPLQIFLTSLTINKINLQSRYDLIRKHYRYNSVYLEHILFNCSNYVYNKRGITIRKTTKK